VRFYFVEELSGGAEVSEDGADADGVLVAPVHASLLAASDDEDSGGGLDMA
jgi:hypothetical protein